MPKAKKLLELSAAQGDVESMSRLLALGEERWWGVAAKHGFAPAMHHTAKLLLAAPLDGAPRNEASPGPAAKALALLTEAVALGDREAAFTLAIHRSHGRFGIPKDTTEAARLFHIVTSEGAEEFHFDPNACTLGESQFRLSMAYLSPPEERSGVPFDAAIGARYACLAASSGYLHATKLLETLDQSICLAY